MSDKYYWMWREEKKKRQEAEGEVTLVKGIGMNSPEMRSIKKELEEVKNDKINIFAAAQGNQVSSAWPCLLYTSPSPRDLSTSRMPSSA